MKVKSRLSGKLLGIPAWVWLLANIVAIVIMTMSGPAEKSLGTHVRVVYLHGAWVWTALAAFVGAASVGLLGLLTRRQRFYDWSMALGRAGLLFWITYLPLSIWAMRSNWNGLFLAEPRWRLAIAFAIGGLIMQIGLAILDKGPITALGNIVYGVMLIYMLRGVQNVMHPRSPIWESGHNGIRFFFTLLLFVTLLLGWQAARLLQRDVKA